MSLAVARPPEQGMVPAALLARLNAVRAVLAPDLNPAELQLFAMVAARSGLDPFAKQIYAVKRKGRVTFQTGIDGYRSIAERTGEYDGQDEPEYGPVCGCGDKRPDGHPEWATVRVYRKGMGHPVSATAYWHEYKPATGDREHPQDGMWVRMPRVMIAKVAEALALRKAFPWDPNRGQGIGADLYTTEEMAQAETPRATTPTPVASTARERAAAARSANPQGSVTPVTAAPLAEEPPADAPLELPEDDGLPRTSAGFVTFVDELGVSSDHVREVARGLGLNTTQISPDEIATLARALRDEERGEI